VPALVGGGAGRAPGPPPVPGNGGGGGAGEAEVDADAPPAPAEAGVAGADGGHRGGGQAGGDPPAGEGDLADGQRVPSRRVRRGRDPVGRAGHAAEQPPQLGGRPAGPGRGRRAGQRPAEQGGQQGHQPEPVERGVMAGDGEAGAAGADQHPQRRLGGEPEGLEQDRGAERLAVDHQRLRRRPLVPDLAAQAGADDRHGPLERLDALVQAGRWRGERGGGHHHPAGAPVGEAQQRQRVARGRRGQRRRPAHRPSGSRRRPR
jgi:hypothetical protein